MTVVKITHIITIGGFAAAFTASVSARKATYGGGIRAAFDTNSIPIITDNYLRTSGLYSSPESVYSYGAEWKADYSALLQRLSTNVVALAKMASTNETAAAELRRIFEFLVSPKSEAPIHEDYGYTDAFKRKYDILINGFHVLSVGDVVDGSNSNTVIAIARTIEFVKSRRHVEYEILGTFSPSGEPAEIPDKTQEELRAEIDLGLQSPMARNIHENYRPRVGCAYDEDHVLWVMMSEIIRAERHLFEKLKTEFEYLSDISADDVPEFIRLIGGIADLYSYEANELQRIYELYYDMNSQRNSKNAVEKFKIKDLDLE